MNILVADAEVTCVFVDSGSGDVVPISGEMKDLWPELAEFKV